MIKLTCTNCKANLEMDDAFAGSTCRCQSCGTIQTVPGKRRPATPTGTESKTLYAKTGRGGAMGSGLDQLADIVASSGLQHQAARTANTSASAQGAAPPRDNRALLVVLGAVGMLVVVLLVVIALLMANRSSSATQSNAPAQSPPSSGVPVSAKPPAAAQPAILDIPLNEQSVVFVIDRGSAMRESLGPSVAATLRSVQSLGSDRRFQVIFWDNGQENLTVPASPRFATADAIASAQRTMENAVAFGQSNPMPAIKQALAAGPAAIVLITAKGFELDEDFLTSTLSLRSQANVKIHTISIGGGGRGEILERLAKATGGTFRAASADDLRQFADQ